MQTEPGMKTIATRFVGLFYPHDRESSSAVARRIREADYRDADVRFITGEPDDGERNVSSIRKSGDFHKMEFAVSIGGDGTFLRVGSLVRELGIPLFGINTGRLGFLASGSPDSATGDIRQILSGRYRLQKRIPLKCVLRGKGETFREFHAINEFAVTRLTKPARLGENSAPGPIEMCVRVDGEHLYNLHADGVIVSTPTGSTAYALSAGGPIVHPEVRSMVIVPVCPHSLYTRPMVLGSEASIEVTFVNGSDGGVLSADGRMNLAISRDDSVVVKTDSEQSVDVIKLDDSSYFDVLRDKLNWGLGNKCT